VPREFSRSQRLGNQVLRTLSQLLREEVKDPRLEDVSLTSVDLSRDLSVARVYFSLLNPDDAVEPAAEGLASAAGFLRSRLSRAIQVRHVPELRFLHDDSIEQSVRISQLIDRAIESGNAEDDPDDGRD
jgi:ribosome-binding factor A